MKNGDEENRIGNANAAKGTAPGRLLANARRERGLSFDEAARATRIPARHLEALERGDASSLPEVVYARVFLRRYAAYLGLDGAALARELGSSREPRANGSAGKFEEPEKGPAAGAEPAGPAAVEARGVSKSYRTEGVAVRALDGVSLRIEEGGLVAVMGPSGCGKTTLLNTLSGLDAIDDGEIFIAGRPLHEMSDAQRTEYRARYMGFIFQGFNLMGVLSAVENVELPLLATGVGVGEARERALETLDQVSLADRAEHRPNQLSGGQQQRVAIARALVNRPAIVWADEPTGNLDSDTSREVLDLILTLNRENGQTFVVVTHDPAVGSEMGRVIQMRDGRIAGIGADPEAAVRGT